MSFNLVDIIKDQVSGPVLGQISNAVGENSDKTQSVIEGAIPALLGGFMDKASSSEGAGALFDAVNSQDDSILDNLSGLIGSDNKTSLIESGGNALGSLFGGSGASGLINAVSGSSGMSAGGAGTVLSMLAPVVMGTVKKSMAGGDSNDASGMAALLMSQKDNIASAMPSGLADQLGSSGLMSNVGNLFSGGAGMAGAAAAGVAGLAGSATGAVSGITDKVGDMAGGAVEGVTGAIGGVTDGLAGQATDAVSGLTGKVGDMAGGAVEGVTGAIGDVTGGLAGQAADAVSGLTGKVGDMAGGAVEGVTGAVGDVTGKVGDIAGGAVGSVSGAIGGAAGGAANLAGSAAGAVGGAASSVGNAAGDVASGGSSWIKKLIIPLVLAVLAFFGWKQFGGSMPDTSGITGAATSAVESATSSVSGTVDSATSAVSGMVGGDMAANITGMFGSATESLGGITDVESAKAAIPALTDFSGKLDGITSMADKLPDAAKPMLAGALEKIMPMLDSVMAIPGVGAVLGGVIEPLKEKLSSLAG